MLKFKKIFISSALILCACALLGCARPENKPKYTFASPQKGVYVVDVNLKECSDCIGIYNSDSLETVEEIAKKTGVQIAINAGFFDPSNMMTTSYVVLNSEMVANPVLNKNLTDNPEIQPYLAQILNRSEFRILNCNEQLKFQIAAHTENADNCKIIHSVQAGPDLFPDLKLEEEAFVIKKDGKVIRESAGALGKYARSALGIKKDHILLVAVGSDRGISIPELSKLMKKLNIEDAMAFDGGSSTSLYVNVPGQQPFNLVSAKDHTARRVKSVLFIK